MSKINAYITFNGKCREAMTFYKGCFGGELTATTIGESPMAGQFPPDMKNGILHSSLNNNELVLMGTDMVDGEGLQTGNNIALSVDCTTEDDMNSYFSYLSNGGQVIYPLDNFFAGRMGVVRDKYGIRWSLYYDNTKK
jgi:PhnB protein